MPNNSLIRIAITGVEEKSIADSKPEERDYLQILEELDQEFIRRNISPGGCADLLAMTYFVVEMEEVYSWLYTS